MVGLCCPALPPTALCSYAAICTYIRMLKDLPVLYARGGSVRAHSFSFLDRIRAVVDAAWRSDVYVYVCVCLWLLRIVQTYATVVIIVVVGSEW